MQAIDQYRNKILYGDSLEVLKTLPSNSIQMSVSSPPYYDQREYGVAGQLGHETTPEEFVRKLVEIYDEVRRVLRPDGICFLNMGDSYWQKGKHKTIKQKDLCLVPQRLEIALQDAGWWIRNDIVWKKPNCMPFPVTDRLLNSHEKIIYMTKSKECFYDAYAVKEPVAQYGKIVTGALRNKRDVWESEKDKELSALQWMLARLHQIDPELDELLIEDYLSNNTDKTDVWTVTVKGTKELHFAVFNEELILPAILAGTSEQGACPICGAPYKRIIEKGEPIKEWKSASGSDTKGEYKGTSEKFLKQDALGKATQTGFNARWKAKQQNASDVKRRILEGMVSTKTVDWEPTCNCYNNKQKGIDTGQTLQGFVRDDKTAVLRAKSREDAVRMYPGDIEKQKEHIRFVHDHGGSDIDTETNMMSWEQSCNCQPTEPVRCIVIDPFMGSGTTAITADAHGLDYIGIDLNKDYIIMAERRIKEARDKRIAEREKVKPKRFESIEPMEK